MSEVITSPASDVKPEVTKQNISAAELVQQRIAQQGQRKPIPVEKPAEAKPEDKPGDAAKPEPVAGKDEAASKESVVEAKPDESKSKDVLSNVDLSELTDEDIQELAQKRKSGLLKRIAELTAKRKMAEERAMHLERVMAQQGATFVEPRVENNPFAAVETVEALNDKFRQVSEVIEWAEEVLDRSESLGADETAAVIEGKSFTKQEIKERLRLARKAKEKYIPAQFRELQGKAQRQAMRSALDQQARQELPWLQEEDNDLKKNFQAIITDPRLKKLEELMPELAPQMGYFMAHAANSIYGRKSIPLDSKPATVQVKPPSMPSSSAAGEDRSESRDDKHLKELASRVQKSGKMNDYVALRTAQLTKRKTIK